MISPAVLLLAAVLHRPPERVHRIHDYAPAHPVLHLAVVEADSEFNFNARHRNRDGSVDEGAYQTNSRWHPRFTDYEAQIVCGADNLEAVIARYPDLRHALGAYNTGNPHKGAAYARRVLSIYQRLLDWLGITREGDRVVTGFEEYTHDLTPQESVLAECLSVVLLEHKGRKKAATCRYLMGELFLATGVPVGGEARMRALIHHVRMASLIASKRDGVLVACSRGYYLTEDRTEIERYMESLDERSRSIRMVRNALMKDLVARIGGQIELGVG